MQRGAGEALTPKIQTGKLDLRSAFAHFGTLRIGNEWSQLNSFERAIWLDAECAQPHEPDDVVTLLGRLAEPPLAERIKSYFAGNIPGAKVTTAPNLIVIDTVAR